MDAVNNMVVHKEEISKRGFTIFENIYSDSQIDQLAELITSADSSKETFRKSGGVFAIRQFLNELPEAVTSIFSSSLPAIILELFGPGYTPVKSIYFDKPGDSNWFVSYHQDLTISVRQRIETDGYGPWTVKQGQFAVQPPMEILRDNFTVRIHLDDTDEGNGALRVIPGSHLKGIVRSDEKEFKRDNEVICPVPKGGIMIMRPLLMHASSRTKNDKRRRVIHIEFSKHSLPPLLEWSEQVVTN